MLENIMMGLMEALQIQTLLVIFFGVATGIAIGALPGLGATMAIALLLPATYAMETSSSLLLLIGIFCGGIYGGSISAILIKTPGTAASAATIDDGYALAQKGKAGTALGMSIYASTFGGVFGGLVLLFLSPIIASYSLRFGPPEYFMLALFGLTIIASVSGESLSKGIVMACLGIWVGCVGLDPVSGVTRFTYGISDLISGFDLIAIVIGIFAISEVFRQAFTGSKAISGAAEFRNEKFGIRQVLPYKKTLFKSSLIGSAIGVLPGVGPTVSSFAAYSEARRSAKDKSGYGKGSLDGIAAAESANNGTTGSALIPLLTLGIPADAATGILLGALILQGVTPGPQFFVSNTDLVYTIIVGFLIINVVMFFQAKLAIRYFAKITMLKSYVLWPPVVLICLVGGYGIANSMYSVMVAIVFGVFAYIFINRLKYPATPLLIAFILGPTIERSLQQSLMMSRGDYMIFLERPISAVFLFLILTSLFYPVLKKWLSRRLAGTDVAS